MSVNRSCNAIAEAVADGRTIDWLAAEHDALEHVERRTIEALREVASVGRFYAVACEGTSFGLSEGVLLPAGSAWGGLQILDHIGRGRFGDVYRAWDPALDREVALKILRATGTDVDTQVIEEGRLMARVRHQNVVTIYGAQRIDGVTGLWMELVDGRTLAAELADSGPFEPAELLRVGIALCGALAAVHDAGLVHRDVKAQNVLRDTGGRIVLGDFGTGRELTQVAHGRRELAGTPVYIAPEVFAGEPATARSDIYSLGALLFHLATGTYPVVGRSLAELRAAHTTVERTSIRMLRPDLPAPLARAIDRALEPDPSRRFHDAGAFQAALEGVTPRYRPLQKFAAVAAILLATVVAGTMILAFNRWTADIKAPDTESAPGDDHTSVQRTSVFAPPGSRFFFQGFSSFALSPDGQWLAFSALDERNWLMIWVQHTESSSPRLLANTEGATALFWSPDSRWIGYSNRRGLQKVSVDGGDPQLLCPSETGAGRFGTWGTSGVILFHRGEGGPIYQVSETGGSCRQLTAEGDGNHLWPSFLPDGRQFLYFAHDPRSDPPGFYLASIDSPGSRLVTTAQAGVAHVASGSMLFMRANRLVAAPFDSVTAALAGEPRVIADGLLSDNAYLGFQAPARGSHFSVSQTGSLAYVKGEPAVVQLRWVNRRGDHLEAIPMNDTRGFPAVSHDGRRIATEIRDAETGNSDIWIYDLNNRISRRITSHPARDYHPVWSPDDTQIVFVSNRLGRLSDIYRVNADGTGEGLVHTSEVSDDATSWESDSILFNRLIGPRSKRAEIWSYSARDRAARPVIQRSDHVYSARMSPDGKWIAYVAQQADGNHVWVRGVPPNDGEYLVGPGRFPEWRGDSREIFYLAPLDGPDEIRSAMVADGASPQVGHSQTLFRLPELAGHTFDVSPDGERFLIRFARDLETLEQSSITIVKDWTRLLKQ